MLSRKPILSDEGACVAIPAGLLARTVSPLSVSARRVIGESILYKFHERGWF